jgi:putative peptide zinc metalloprotease protein
VRRQDAQPHAAPPATALHASVARAPAPACPALAPGVQLVGELQGGGFRQRQWLVQRGERFVQVTELLYRVMEQADGERTYEAIAARLSEAIDRQVMAEDVRYLVETRLAPLGLVTVTPYESRPGDAAPTADAAPIAGPGTSREPCSPPSPLPAPTGTELASGAPAALPADAGGSPQAASTASDTRGAARFSPRSPLSVNLRLRLLSPRVIDPIVNVLQVLYWPPLLVSLLGLTVLAYGWAYLGAGLGAGLEESLQLPGRLLLVFALAVASTLCHEFGHAAALRYGGGQVRGIGAGFYLVYPVFYTDVTDSYRLGRWARLRTDLGGFYFQLLFALGVIAVAAVTGQPFLLLVVTLINLQIVRECLPLGRFDGYWALADLTGIPDFLTYVVPFVRRYLPFRRRRTGAAQPALPEIKPWVAVVFGTYVVALALTMTVFFVTLTLNAPRIVVRLAATVQRQLGAFVEGHTRGDPAAMTLALLQILVAMLFGAGCTYMLLMGLRQARGVWQVSSRWRAGLPLSPPERGG